nr:uncharacterized protein LOC114819592 [Malus domestica]
MEERRGLGGEKKKDLDYGLMIIDSKICVPSSQIAPNSKLYDVHFRRFDDQLNSHPFQKFQSLTFFCRSQLLHRKNPNFPNKQNQRASRASLFDLRHSIFFPSCRIRVTIALFNGLRRRRFAVGHRAPSPGPRKGLHCQEGPRSRTLLGPRLSLEEDGTPPNHRVRGIRASVSETILETLEMIEDLDIREGISTMESMKAAYCAVATECTVKFLVGFMGKPSGKYLEAVDRIWRGRVGVLERSGRSQLVSAELRHRMDEVEAGVWDLRVSKKLSRMNTRNDALRLLAVYVKAALALLGPPFITWAIRLNVPKEVADLEADQITVANEANVGCGSEVEGQKKKGAYAGDRTELEVQMANGDNVGAGVSELENQMANGDNAGAGVSELGSQMANRANVGGDGGSELDAQMANQANVGVRGLDLEAETENETTVGGRSDMEVQMENGTDAGDGSELGEQMVNGTNVGDGDQLEEQTRKEANVTGDSELEAQMMSGASLVDRSEPESQTVNGTNEGVRSQRQAQTTNRSNVGSQSALEEQQLNAINFGEESELGPILVAVPLKEVRAGSSPSLNGELDLSIDHTTKDKENQSAVPRHKHLAHRRTRGPIRIGDAEDSSTEVSNRKIWFPFFP